MHRALALSSRGGPCPNPGRRREQHAAASSARPRAGIAGGGRGGHPAGAKLAQCGGHLWLSQVELLSRVGIHFRSKLCPWAASRRELSFAVLHVLRDDREPPPAREMWLSQVGGGVKFTATKQL